MRRVLRADGSLYLHCDPTASHYLKALLDAVFGRGNFKNEVVWHYQTGGVGKRWYARKHDVILFYTKTKTYSFQPERAMIPRTAEVLRRIESGIEGATRATDKWKLPMDVWTDIQALNAMSKERKGYPTQKPVALLERILKASSNHGDIVLDPFAGCATTPIAAERLGRQWVAMDIWEGAAAIVRQRLADSRQLLTDADPQIHYVTAPPVRTDGGHEAVPFLQVTERYAEPNGPRMSRADMYDHLLRQYGQKCQGCDRVFDDSRYLELDHNTPRSDGGLNHIYEPHPVMRAV